MARILIIGIGNNLRSDDGVGWRVAVELSERMSASDVDVIAVQQLLPEIAEPVSRAEKVLFVDALQNGTPGSIQVQRVAPAGEWRLQSHHLTPASVLKLAVELYQGRPQAFLLTVGGECFSPGEDLSETASAALPAVSKAIERFVWWARNGDSCETELLNKVNG
jgi:hydrogenase maturation protease